MLNFSLGLARPAIHDARAEIALLDENFCMVSGSRLNVPMDESAEDIRLSMEDGQLYATYVNYKSSSGKMEGRGLWYAPIEIQPKPFSVSLDSSAAQRLGGFEEKNFENAMWCLVLLDVNIFFPLLYVMALPDADAVEQVLCSGAWQGCRGLSAAGYAWFVIGVVWLINSDFHGPCAGLTTLTLGLVAAALLKPLLTMAASRSPRSGCWMVASTEPSPHASPP